MHVQYWFLYHVFAKKIRTNVIFGPFAFVVSVKQPQRMHEPPTWRRQKYFWDVTFFACFQDIISVFFFDLQCQITSKKLHFAPFFDCISLFSALFYDFCALFWLYFAFFLRPFMIFCALFWLYFAFFCALLGYVFFIVNFLRPF